MTAVILAIFIATYVGMALGRVPGLAIDRSGMALIAAVLVVVLGAVAPESVGGAIHFPTLILLFALMIVSARFAAAGIYDWLAARIAAAAGSPQHLLALTTTLAGNFLLVGSIANLIVAERAASAGAGFGFREHARAGVPMTLISMALAVLWLWGGGWLGW